MAKCINNRNHYSLAVNGYNDHVHLLVNYKGHELISDFVREIKKSSSNFIKEKRLCSSKFEWQQGYGGFTNGYREVEKVIKYIKNQEHHHQTNTFKNEYLELLNKYDVEFKGEYLFEFF
jgi:REP element-mobilizing transposase RayT